MVLWHNLRPVAVNGLAHTFAPGLSPARFNQLPSTRMDMELSSGLAAYAAKEFGRAMQLLSPLAQMGDPQAQFCVAIMYQNGLGVVPNPGRALIAMRAAATEGHGPAQHMLGFMYLHGEGVERDAAKAAEWFLMAVEQGLEGAMAVLAQMYAAGDGVPRDEAKARDLYARAGFEPDELQIPD
jgi:uncharacterized protein